MQDSQNNNDIKVSNFVVTFLDILGQQYELKGCGLVHEDRERLEVVAKNTILRMRFLDCEFDKFYKKFTSVSSGRHSGLKVQRFSDSLSLFTDLGEGVSPDVLANIYAMIVSSGVLLLICLNKQFSIRGGIEIGWATFDDNQYLYGCALSKAYLLENKAAGYPRIVIGNNLIKFLDELNKIRPNNDEEKQTKDIAGLILQLVCEDFDDKFIVDYLGKGFVSYIHQEQASSELFQPAKNFIENKIAHFKSIQDRKLLVRYERLNDYFERNSSLWGF